MIYKVGDTVIHESPFGKSVGRVLSVDGYTGQVWCDWRGQMVGLLRFHIEGKKSYTEMLYATGRRK